VEQVRNLAGGLLMLEQMGASGLDVSDIGPGQDVVGYDWARSDAAIDQTARAIVREARLLIDKRQGKGYRFTLKMALKMAPKVVASPGDTVLVGYSPETCAADMDDLYRQLSTLPPESPYHIVVPAVALAKAVVIKPGEHVVLRLPASLSKAEEEAILDAAGEARSGNVTLVHDDVGVEATRDPAVLILSAALRECAEVLGLMPGEVASKAVPREVRKLKERNANQARALNAANPLRYPHSRTPLAYPEWRADYSTMPIERAHAALESHSHSLTIDHQYTRMSHEAINASSVRGILPR
jgi:hypothetical protein